MSVAGLGWFLVTAQVSSPNPPRLSVGPAGLQANNNSYYPAISGDGRHIAFWSVASNLVAADTNAVSDVFVFDQGTI